MCCTLFVRYCVYDCVFIDASAHTHKHNCLAVHHRPVVWLPSRVCPLIHMILFGIDRAVINPLPFSSLCPPPLLLSSAPGQGWMARNIECAKPSFVFHPDTTISSLSAGKTPNFSFQVFSFICLPPLLSVFPLHFPCFFLFFNLSPPASSCLLLSVSLILSHSIINFNLRAGLNGTIRGRSMLSIWMPAHLDLSIVTPDEEKGIFLFIIGQIHHLRKHTNH